MTKKSLLLIYCLVIASIGFGQINFNYLQTDSLRHELSKAKNDTGRVLLMANLAEGYRWSNPDSAMYFGQSALQLAKQIDFQRGQAAALISISVVHRELGNLAKALDLAMQALAIAQRHKFAVEEVSALIRVANVYSSANNYSKALIYLHQSEDQSRNNGNKLYENISQWLIASAFERTNNLDSAIYYADRAFKNVSWEAGTDFAYNILGDIQLKLKKDTLALNSYRIGLKEAERASDYRTEANLSVSLANYYKKHNQMDSAVYYAKKALAVAQILSYKNRIISSSSILADIYETTDPQEALKYYRIYNAAKDSLYGSEKMQALQTFMMEEQEKQKKTEAAQLAYQNRVKQFGLLTGLLFVLAILSLLYRNNRRKQKANELLQKQKQEIEERKAQAEIETALEKVRTIAMSMRSRDDMLEICKVIADQLTLLNIKEIRNVQTAIFYEEKGTYMNYEFYARHDKLLITEVDYKHHPTQYEFAYKMLQGSDEFFTLSLKGQELKDWYEYQKTTPQFADSFLKTAPSLNYYWYSMGPVALGLSSYQPLSEEQIILFKQFRNVFELSYRRYLDIEKAEAQAREAQIQLALERVRARTMAMQHSNELKDAAALLFQQVKSLGAPAYSCGYNIWEKDDKEFTSWMSSQDGSIINGVPNIPLTEDTNFIRYVESKQNSETFFVLELRDERMQEHYQYLKTIPAFKAYFDYAVSVGFDLPKTQIHHLANFSHGNLLFITLEPCPEFHSVFKRFAAVFEQTYTRFLDLQKSEAQARESQIEAALERVRSRTMGMQKSEELKEVIRVVYEQFVHLNIKIEHTGFVIDYKARDDYNIWIADPLGVPSQVTVPYFDCVYYNRFNEAKKNGEGFFATNLGFEEKNKFYQQLFEYVPGLTEEVKKFYFSCPGLAASTVLLDNVCLYIENFSGIPYSDEDNTTLMRFGKVFQQTYTRFLDLQKVEAQAREATIETALEKVRGKAMAMHNSNDISVTASMVFTELRKLGINPIRCGVGLLNKESRKAQLYSAASSPDGDSLSLVGWVLLENHPVLEKIYDTWQKGEDYFPELTGEQLKHYYELLLAGLPVNVPDWQDGQKQYGHFFSFSIGCLYAWSENPYSDAEIKILKRFASIIDLTFRRYLDLQKSEASTKEAVKQAALDRIRADIASMRTVNDLDRIIPLVWNELTTLGVPFIRCGVFIMKNDEQQIHTFLSTPDGKAIASFHLPYDSPGNISKVVSHWKNNEIYKDHWDDDAFREFANSLVKQGALKSSKQYLSTLPVGGFYLHFVPFLQGMLYVGNTTELSNDEMKLLQAVAEAFSTAYARYEDFNKLEGAKKQVERTLVDLKQAQTQLVQSEKMASLGELTAGIAHEIQNPLNFVNNFSEVSSELMDEIKAELDKGDTAEAKAIADDVKQNLEKITHHGKRADAIVKSMLQHSRKSSGQKDLVDINALVDEYLRLSYHGFRAKEKSFNAIIETHFDVGIGKVSVIGQDIGRVLLNLFNNAFYAVNEKIKIEQNGFEPTLQVTTTRLKEAIEIKIKDNGIGIPEKVLEKIYQPFFTTKPTGEGTGLGLSLSYDVITKGHGGQMKVQTSYGQFTEFTIQLPAVYKLVTP